MNGDKSYSDEMLNAYLDGELESDERAQVLEALRRDEELSRRVCQLQKVHSMVQLAYQDAELPTDFETPHATRSPRPALAVAAGLLIIISAFLGGWIFQSNQNQTLVELAQEVRNNQAIPADSPWHLVVQMSTDDDYRINVALNEIERLLQENQQQPVDIEIVANGKGMKLLRSDTSPYASRIRDLQQRYRNLIFQACGKTIARLKKEQGVDFDLIPGTQIVPSAMSQVIKRQKEGWTYIHI